MIQANPHFQSILHFWGFWNTYHKTKNYDTVEKIWKNESDENIGIFSFRGLDFNGLMLTPQQQKHIEMNVQIVI